MDDEASPAAAGLVGALPAPSPSRVAQGAPPHLRSGEVPEAPGEDRARRGAGRHRRRGGIQPGGRKALRAGLPGALRGRAAVAAAVLADAFPARLAARRRLRSRPSPGSLPGPPPTTGAVWRVRPDPAVLAEFGVAPSPPLCFGDRRQGDATSWTAGDERRPDFIGMRHASISPRRRRCTRRKLEEMARRRGVASPRCALAGDGPVLVPELALEGDSRETPTCRR